MSMEAVEAPSADVSEGASESTVDNTGSPAIYDDLVSAYDAIVAENQQPDDEEFDGTGDDATEMVADDGVEDSDAVESVQDWNWREYASNQIPVKIDGQETNVPLEELRNGYMRQADYTRKTQEVAELQKLAEWAQEFQDRFKQDPQGMVRMLASAVGFDGVQQQTEPDPFEELIAADPDLAPLAQTIRQQQNMISELREELAALGGRTVETQSEIQFQKNVDLVRKEIEQVKSKFDDFDEMQILPIAAQTGLDLTASYFLWKGSQSANGDVQPQVETPPAKKANPAKKQVAKSVTNSRFAGEPSTDGEQYDSFAELFEIVARTEGQ